MFLAIDKAWKLLSDNETRENCDRQLKGTCDVVKMDGRVFKCSA